MKFTTEQLGALQNLARRSHDGEVTVNWIVDPPLSWIEVTLNLLDVSEPPPQTYWVNPKGIVEPVGGRGKALAALREELAS